MKKINLENHEYTIDDNEMRHGKYVESWPNKNVKILQHYKHGVLNGLSETYYDSGTIRTRVNYLNGKKHGELIVREQFHDYVELKENYDHGLLHGERIAYRNGIIGSVVAYDTGVASSITRYYDDGKLKSSMKFKNDYRDEEVEYYDGDKIKAVTTWKDDIIHSYIKYDKNGDIEHDIKYVNGFKHGKTIEDYRTCYRFNGDAVSHIGFKVRSFLSWL